MASTSLTLGEYWEDFIKNEIASGRFGSASEVVRTALRTLEETLTHNKLEALRVALIEGELSGDAGELNVQSIRNEVMEEMGLANNGKKIHLQEKAKEDLKEIWRYTYEKWGLDKADEYLSLLTIKFNHLKLNPNIGKECNDIRTGYRQYPVEKHIVFYKNSTYSIRVIRILHQSRNISEYIIH